MDVRLHCHGCPGATVRNGHMVYIALSRFLDGDRPSLPAPALLPRLDAPGFPLPSSPPWAKRPQTTDSESNQHSLHLRPPLIAFTPLRLEDAILKALETHFLRNSATTNNARTKFYNNFQQEADEHDSDFVKKCGGDLDTTLIFVCYSPSLIRSGRDFNLAFRGGIGRFVFGGRICFHPRRSDSASTRLRAIEPRPS